MSPSGFAAAPGSLRVLSPPFRWHRFCAFVVPTGIGAAKTVDSTAGAVADREVFEMRVGGSTIWFLL